LKLKEFLSVRGIVFDSVNILDDPDGLAELRRLGARSIPVLSRGDDWVFAQNIGHVVKFLGLNEATGPVLSASQLMERLDLFLDTAARIIPMMPDDKMETLTPNRPRSYRVLSYHIFRIAEAFLETASQGIPYTHEMPGKLPPDEVRTSADVAAYGVDVRRRLHDFWAALPDKSGSKMVETYYGPQKLHELAERSTWHSGQHVRQWFMLLGMAGINEAPLPASAFANLPMPSSVWDG
jgi:hypothetical protein